MRHASLFSRMRSHWYMQLLAGLPCMLLAGEAMSCTDAPPTSVAPLQPPAGTAGSAAEPSGPSFTAVYDSVFVSCQNKACHGGRDGLGLRMETRDTAYSSLVDQPASETVGMCGGKGLVLIVPFKPEESLVFLKVSGQPPCGGAMPPGGSPTAEQVEQLKAWIAAGAPDN
jgi:hypothetical protein